MLFSDIEGSAALLSRLGGRYGEALPAQNFQPEPGRPHIPTKLN
jgi:hypothetical protein